MKHKISRRHVLVAGSAAIGSGVVTRLTIAQQAGEVKTTENAFVYCLNTSTVRGQKLPLVTELEIAAKVGYSAVEPWVNEIADYQKKGGTLMDLRKRIADLGLTIEDAIGFAEWIVNDDAKREKGMEQAKRDINNLLRVRLKEPGMTIRYAGTDVVDLRTVDWVEITDAQERTFRLAVRWASCQ